MLGTMSINLDSFELLNYELGSESNLPDGAHQNGSVSFFIENSIIKNVYVRLSEFYSEGEIYEGNLIINGEIIAVNKQLQPAHVFTHFTNQTAHWEDGVEVNYQFQLKKVNIEFSWHRKDETLIPNYIGIESE